MPVDSTAKTDRIAVSARVGRCPTHRDTQRSPDLDERWRCEAKAYFGVLTFSSQVFEPLTPSRKGSAVATSFGEKKMS